ncbi:ABC transporter substrate-binding protein [Pseudoroseomonas deserti]|uniref:ABC transporter substrate-binding protein n=1 Tax=Teichococcus deserti TaxID=1817963 RepID=A0A1V2H4I6_9PROT|nr:ABC transporter substrate-binding protein [Pseudoroseomonas deserti]ONG53789.1 ABC transporter substrate-binding protein [Pseudoroseomonas deserti]
MRRRTLLAASLIAPFIARPAAAQAATRLLRFVPQGDIANLDPIWGTSYSVRNAALLVWDTLYGIDARMQPQRQMVEQEEVSADGLTWHFRLRPGLVFHDGTPVTARDAVASLRRWAARDVMGQNIAAIEDSLTALDERSFRWVLKRPFPKMLYALAKSNTPCTFVMPERIARTDPGKVITEYIGSGPMKMVTAEWQVGARVVFERFAGYQPRPEPASWMAGGKRMLVDRIEWLIIPDGATAAGALQTGEVDWLESPLPDLVPQLERHRDIRTGIANDLGVVSGVRLNHLQPPFDKIGIRRAMLAGIRQDDYLSALVGEDSSLRRPMNGYFTPGTPLYTEAGDTTLARGGDLELAKRLLRESGYAGEKIVMLTAQDSFAAKAVGDVAADMFRRIGMTIDYVSTDFATIQSRRLNRRAPPEQGGWHSFQVSHAGTDCINPAAYLGLRANGEKGWFGWPDSPAVEAGIAEWYDSASLEQEKKIAEKINAAALADVIFLPTGFFLAKQAWRSNVAGVVTAPIPVFWDVSKSA